MNVKDIETMFIEQILEILEILEKYNNLQEIKKDILIRKEIYKEQLEQINQNSNLNLYNELIDEKLANKQIELSQQKEYKQLEKQYKELYKILENSLSQDKKSVLDELRGIIHELEGYESHLAFKMGLIEGIEIKEEVK